MIYPREHDDSDRRAYIGLYIIVDLRIELTVGTYGGWLRKKASGAVDRLDTREVVAERPKG